MLLRAQTDKNTGIATYRLSQSNQYNQKNCILDKLQLLTNNKFCFLSGSKIARLFLPLGGLVQECFVSPAGQEENLCTSLAETTAIFRHNTLLLYFLGDPERLFD